MAINTVGDLFSSTMLRTRMAAVKTTLDHHTAELASGLKEDVGAAVRHDFSTLTSLERNISLNETYLLAAVEAELFTDSSQLALDSIEKGFADLSPALSVAASNGESSHIQAVAASAEQMFHQAVSHLNTQVGGRALFAGQNTSDAALSDAQTILDALQPLAAAATTAADWDAALDAWFAPGGDFDTIAYTGSDTALQGFRVSEAGHLAAPPKADHTAIRSTLKALASVALITETSFTAETDEMHSALTQSNNSLLTAQADLVGLRAEIGLSQQAIETAQVQLATEKTTFEIARNAIVVADPYEAATRFEEASVHLESLYAVTARLSRMNLADYL